jgi:hypothetical protein
MRAEVVLCHAGAEGAHCQRAAGQPHTPPLGFDGNCLALCAPELMVPQVPNRQLTDSNSIATGTIGG